MRIALMALLFSCFSTGLWACGAFSDCPVGSRHYRIMMPEGHDLAAPVPAIVFAHGFRSSASGVLRNPKLRKLGSDLGVALIAVKSAGPSWDLPNGPTTINSDGSAEYEYFDAVVQDVVSRFKVDKGRIVASGFSNGGMMVWYLACQRPGLFSGFIPISGTFWKEPPETCAEPVSSIIHIHGDRDTTVPLLGRPIRETKQGKVPEVLDMYASFGGFGRPEGMSYDGLACKERRNETGQRLDFCLFSGGHWFDPEHLRHGWTQLEAAGQF